MYRPSDDLDDEEQSGQQDGDLDGELEDWNGEQPHEVHLVQQLSPRHFSLGLCLTRLCQDKLLLSLVRVQSTVNGPVLSTFNTPTVDWLLLGLNNTVQYLSRERKRRETEYIYMMYDSCHIAIVKTIMTYDIDIRKIKLKI